MRLTFFFICCIFCVRLSVAQNLSLEEQLAKAMLENNQKEAKRLLKEQLDINYLYKGNPLLSLAIQMDNHEIAGMLVEKNASIMLSDCRGVSPLYLASTSYDLEMLSVVLGHNYPHDLRNALIYAISRENSDNIRFILNSLKDINYQTIDGVHPMILACETGNISIVRLLEEHGIPLNYTSKSGDNCMLAACRNQNDSLVQYLALKEPLLLNHQDPSGKTPLHLSILTKNSSLTRILIDQGADYNIPDETGVTPFLMAYNSDNYEGGKILLQKILQTEKSNIHPGFMDALSSGNAEWVKAYLEAGLNPDSVVITRNEDYSIPLVMASGMGYVEIVEYLIRDSVNLNRVDPVSRETALNIACKNYHSDIAELLIRAGCDTSIPDSNGSSTLTLALHSGQRNIVALLLADRKLINADKNLKAIVDSVHCNLQNIQLSVRKSRFVLSLVAGKDTLKQYDVCLGHNPVDNKIQQGDGCTPEGVFRIIARYAHENWSRFLYFDYPNEESWRRFNRAKANGDITEDARIGGEVGIHGVPAGCDSWIDERINWTAGCIALRNADINELYEFVTVGTRLTIQH